MNVNAAALLALALLLVACGKKEADEPDPSQAVESSASRALEDRRRDPFTYANYDSVRVTDLALEANVLFNEKTLDAVATLTF